MRGTAITVVEHGEYYLWHPGRASPFARFDASSDKLMYLSDSVDDGGILVRTGTYDGPVSVTIETFDQPPATPPDGAEWERIEDLTAVSKGDLVKAIKGDYEIEGVPELTVAPGDRYHVRLATRGVEAGRAEQVLELDDEPVEHHLVQLWREQ
jgi:hypothetical protein